jgi:hypothetical protein
MEVMLMMTTARAGMAALLGYTIVLWATPAMAQSNDVPLIMLRPQGASSLSGSRLKKLYAAIKKRSQYARGQVLPLTKTEIWMVPEVKVEGVRKAAARYGVVMNRLSATWNQVFRKAPAEARINDRQRSLMDRAKASLAALGVGMMATPQAPLVEYALTKDAQEQGKARDAASITVTLSDNTQLTLRRTSVEVRADMCIWRGVVDGTGEPATLMWWPGGRTTGTIQHAGSLYSIRHLGGELHAVVEMAENRMPLEHAPMMPRPRRDDPTLRDDPLVQQGDASAVRPGGSRAKPPVEGSVATASGTPRTDVIIDVMVAYTGKAAGNYADVRHDLVDLAIEEANESFRISGLDHIKLRLVHAFETNYVEQGEHFEHLYRMVDLGDGHLEDVHKLRDKHRADVVVLIVDDAKGCGLATRVYADADEAFAVVHHECAASTYSVAHEIGHIIGARHDLMLDKIMTPFPYGHGYVSGNKWRDIMSYKGSCGGCPRLPVWSSPLVKVRGETAGTPNLDNARVLREQAARVAAFR